jgi:hypothetical protein
MWEQIFEQYLEARKENPEIISLIGWGLCAVVFSTVSIVRKMGRTPTWGEFGNALFQALQTPTGWRWGMGKDDDAPTGKSIVYDLNGKRVVCNFKTGCYFLGNKPINPQLTKKERKSLNRMRDQIVAVLKANDKAAQEAAAEAEKKKLLSELALATAKPSLTSSVTGQPVRRA